MSSSPQPWAAALIAAALPRAGTFGTNWNPKLARVAGDPGQDWPPIGQSDSLDIDVKLRRDTARHESAPSLPQSEPAAVPGLTLRRAGSKPASAVEASAPPVTAEQLKVSMAVTDSVRGADTGRILEGAAELFGALPSSSSSSSSSL